MKRFFLYALIGSLAISGCTTAYKTGQTPDDVYYSPASASSSEEYVRYENNDRRRYNGGLYNDDYYEDRYLRMRVADRYRWSMLDDYYFHNRHNYFYGGALGMWNNPYNNFYTWNGFYNPYFTGFYSPFYSGWGHPVIIGNTKYSNPPSKAFAFNPGSYYNTAPNRNLNTGGRYSGYTNGNSNNNNRSIFNNSNRSSNTNNSYNTYKSDNGSYSTPSRSYAPANSGGSTTTSTSSGSSSSSSGSGSSGPVTRPPR